MILIALGGNIAGNQGPPLQTLIWAINEMAKFQLFVKARSSFYATKAIGQEGQPDYLNAIAMVQTGLPASNLLQNLKMIEKLAGRNTASLRTSGRWGSRPLDLDIIDYKGLVTKNYHMFTDNDAVCKKLVLPHPKAHLRPFVIRPVLDINPFWHHPVSGLSALGLWAGLRSSPQGKILAQID